MGFLWVPCAIRSILRQDPKKALTLEPCIIQNNLPHEVEELCVAMHGMGWAIKVQMPKVWGFRLPLPSLEWLLVPKTLVIGYADPGKT